MRKLTILLALAALTASGTGCCGVCGRVRNFFHKGSPCGTTTVTPVVLGAPLAMGTPLMQPMAQPIMAAPMAQPMMAAPSVCCEQAPACVQQCDPCDPCGGVTTGYAGGYATPMAAGCGCAGGDATMTVTPGTTLPPGATMVPGPVAE